MSNDKHQALRDAADHFPVASCCGREECGGECGNEYRGMTSDAERRAEANRPAVPEGWKLVPVEPTPDMLKHGEVWAKHCGEAYHAMLDAAPAPPASEDSPSVEKSSVIRAPQRGGR